MTSVAVWLGTLILFVPTPHGALVSADSRFDGGDPAKRDQARKIFLCGRAAVCAVSGGLRLEVKTEDSSGTLDIAALLEETSAKMRAAEDQTPEALSTAMHREIAAFWERYLNGRRVAAPMSLRLGAPSVCTILFAAPGRLVQIQFPFIEQRTPDGLWTHELREPAMRVMDPTRPLAQGHTECHPRTMGEIDELYARAQESEACRAVIGGPIDIAVIEGNEARWLRNKLTPPEKVDQPAPLAVH
jgi:hypothetical protein